jgi:hypothetical protein
MTNGKLLKIKGRPFTKMSGVSTMTKFRTEQIMVAPLTARDDPCVFWQVVDLLPDRQGFSAPRLRFETILVDV